MIPIMVSYHPDNDDVLFIPGLDSHDGELPKLGQGMPRDIQVAFGIQSVDLTHAVTQQPSFRDAWAPQSVSGFWDNRSDGANTDYAVARESLLMGMNGRELIEDLVL